MHASRFDSKEGLDTAWAGARAAGAMPAHGAHDRNVEPVHAAADDGVTHRTSWVRGALRVVRNAVIGLALLSTIPMGLVASRRAEFIPNMSHLVAKTAEADRWREFRAPVDPSITHQQAGDALRRIITAGPRDNYPMRPLGTTHARPWNRITLAPDMFADMRTPQHKGPAAFMVIAKTPGGYSVSEMVYLRDIATAPFWKDFDAVSLAAKVDVVGGLYDTPFTPDAQLIAFPTVDFQDAKQIASAAVSRATYYLASGKPADAERVLRTIISFGFTFIDQGVTAVDALVGRMVVDIGRDGLHQLYLQTGRGDLVVRLEPVVRPKSSVRARQTPFDVASARAAALSLIGDPAVPRSLRMETLEMLSYGGSCGSVGAMLTGPSDELRRAVASARASMARYPSEQAFFDLIERTMENGPRVERDADIVGRVASGTASMLSAITGNPRIATCTRLASTIRTTE